MTHSPEIAAIILAGGKGSRFTPIIESNQQKVLFDIGGKPLIQHTTDILDQNVICRLVFNLGHKAEDVERWVRFQGFRHAHVEFSTQTEWTIYNAVTLAVKKTQEQTIIICNADEIRFGLNLQEVLDFHSVHGRLMTVVGTDRSNLSRHRFLTISSDGTLLSSEYCPERFRECPTVKGRVHTGFAVVERGAMDLFDPVHPSGGWGAMLDPLCQRREVIVFYQPTLPFFNVGTLEELLSARLFFASI